MKAALRSTYGGPEKIHLLEIEKPTPKPNELLVRVMASTVSRTDCGILTGYPWAIRLFIGLFKPSLVILGTDFAGIVEAMGDQVTQFKVGDRVWGFNDEGLGSHVQYMCIKEKAAVVKITEGISFEHAAASAEGPHYSINFLRKVHVQPGQKAMVNGASGGIGSAMVQILKNKGLYVAATCTTETMDHIRTLGADKLIDYTQRDFTQDDDTYDYVFDAVGKSDFRKCKPLLKSHGVYISSELGPGAENIYLPLLTAFSKQKVKFPVPLNIKESLVQMNRLLSEGKFHPLIDRTYTLEQLPDAYTYVLQRQKIGNVLINLA
jgi:NADPH:quinone reductase-like Zn-dependent oxidoreductase